MGEITYTDHVRDNVGSQASNPEAARLKVYCLTLCDLLDRLTVEVDRLADEVDRLRAENARITGRASAAAYEDEQVRRLAAEREVSNLRAVFTRTKVHLCDEVDRLRAENTALAAALEDIAGITYSPAHEVYVNGECHRFQDPPCHEAEPTDPEDWCVTCVAEVAWSAWKMGALG